MSLPALSRASLHAPPSSSRAPGISHRPKSASAAHWHRPENIPRQRSASCRAAMETEAPATDLEAMAEELAEAAFCGDEGFVMERPAPADVVPNGRKYHIHTFGCQMNLADSERIAGVLDTVGYECTSEPSDADVLIFNTCSIREKAEAKVYSALGRQANRKRKAMGDLKIVVAGCVAQQEGEQLLRRVPEVDLVMGPQHANRIAALLDQVDEGSQVLATEEMEIVEDVTQPRRESDITAWVNAIYGCNERCTYCVVPNTRGQEQSRRPADIYREMEGLGRAGYREVTLLGQNIDAYGRDLPGLATDGTGRRLHTFTGMLRYVHDVPGIERIRFATSHPRYFTSRLIQACAELPKLCEFFHIPFQSGDDDILREMKRGYTHTRYRRIIDDIRRRMPDASISGDAIVGFPGETEEQYLRTEALVREVGFDRVNTAAYSPRPATPAALRENQVADLIKKDRLQRLNAVVNEVAEERAQRFLDRTMEVLVEGVNPKNPSQAFGRIRQNKLVYFDGDGEALKGSLVQVHIGMIRAYSLFAKLV